MRKLAGHSALHTGSPISSNRHERRNLMRSHLVGRLAATAALLMGTATAVGAGAALATASPAGAQTGAYGGSASGNLVAASAITIPGTLNVANVAVGPSTAQVSSSAALTAAPGENSYARAANLDAQLISGTIPLNNLLVEAKQSAPPDNPTGVTKTLLSVPADPLVHADVATAFANARWLGADQCLPVGSDIAHSTSSLANASVLTNTTVLGSAAVSLNNSSGGPVTSDSTVGLIAVPGQNGEGVRSTQNDQLTGIVLFKGSPQELTVNVLAPPHIAATATGQPGGASVDYTEPILQILQGGKVIGTLDAKTANTSLTVPGIATLSLGKLTQTLAPDGTSATGSASLLTVAVGIAPLPLNVATIAIAPSSVTATVPAGGVICTNPLGESHKDATASVVAPGQTFNYTVTVPNRGSCTLDPVSVTDTVTAPAGTTIVGSVPPATTTNGLTLTYSDIGPLAPNQTVNIQITVMAPTNMANGAQFSNAGTVTGVCQGSPAGTPPFTQQISYTGPQGFTPASSGCHLDDSNKATDHLQVTPGESFDYYIHVFNDGTSDCHSVVVTDPLGGGVTFVSATNGGALSGNTVTWNIPTVASGASVTLAVTVTANASDAVGTTLPDTATINSPDEGHPVNVATGGPTVSTISVLAPPNPATPASGNTNSGASNGPTQTLPTTGGHPLAPYGLGLLVAGFAAWGWRRRSLMQR